MDKRLGFDNIPEGREIKRAKADLVSAEEGTINLNLAWDIQKKWDGIREGMDRLELDELADSALLMDVGASTRIEGSPLSDAEVNVVLGKYQSGRRWNNQPLLEGRWEEEVAGTYDLVRGVTDFYRSMNLTHKELKVMHSTLLKHSTKDQDHRGAYKKVPNYIAGYTALGRQYIVFEPTQPEDTLPEMRRGFKWAEHELFSKYAKTDKYDPITVIACFVMHFLFVHPFIDGNGRMARAITRWLLMKKHLTFVKYSSMDAIIEERRMDYYRAIKATQDTFLEDDDKPDWTPFLGFFNECLVEAGVRLLENYE